MIKHKLTQFPPLPPKKYPNTGSSDQQLCHSAAKEVPKPSPATRRGQKSKGSADSIDPTDGREKKRQVFQSPATRPWSAAARRSDFSPVKNIHRSSEMFTTTNWVRSVIDHVLWQLGRNPAGAVGGPFTLPCLSVLVWSSLKDDVPEIGR